MNESERRMQTMCEYGTDKAYYKLNDIAAQSPRARIPC